MKLSLVYVGLPRYEKLGRTNHKSFLKKLNDIAEVTVYDYTQPKLDRTDCPFDVPAQLQLWDFYKILELVPDNIIIKIRTDIWFTDDAVDIIISKIKEFNEKEWDILFIGDDHENPDTELNFFIQPTIDYKKSSVKDLIVVARKNKILSYDEYFIKSDSIKNKYNGNLLFKCIISNFDQSYTLGTKIFLIKKEYNYYPSDVEIITNWASAYNFAVPYLVNKK